MSDIFLHVNYLSFCIIFYILVIHWVFCILIGRKIGLRVKEGEYVRIGAKYGKEEQSREKHAHA